MGARKRMRENAQPLILFEFKKSGTLYSKAKAQMIGELLALAMDQCRRVSQHGQFPQSLYGLMAIGTVVHFVKATFSDKFLFGFLQNSSIQKVEGVKIEFSTQLDLTSPRHRVKLLKLTEDLLVHFLKDWYVYE